MSVGATTRAAVVDAGAQSATRERAPDLLVALLAATVSFVAAWLVFGVQPMATRMVLPRLGGGAAVWNTSMVFFQLGLLAGYALTHLTSARCSPRAQVGVHLVLVALALLFLPLDIADRWMPPATGSPAFWLMGVYALTIGLPYVALCSISPLVQRWFSMTDHPRAADPYFLYAASNAGSLLGLLAYPVLVEPNFALSDQARVWAGLYLFFGLAVVAFLVVARPDRGRVSETPAPLESDELAQPVNVWRERARWMFWAFLPSSLLLGATTYVTTDVASVPLLWVVPLAIFLLTYIVAFAVKRFPLRLVDHLMFGAAACVAATVYLRPQARFAVFLVHLVALTLVGLAFHGRLARSRPASHRLTEFFLCTSLGGVLGGAFNALVAPLVFDRVLEYGVVLAVAVFATWDRDRYRNPRSVAIDIVIVLGVLIAVAAVDPTPLVFALAMTALGCALRSRAVAIGALVLIFAVGDVVISSDALTHRRDFYGAFVVKQAGGFNKLSHGTTIHGVESLDPELRGEPGSYYARTGPIGRVFAAYGNDPLLDQVGVIGLGAGSLAAYSVPNRSMTFFEIDPEMRDIATNPEYFHYVSDAAGPVDIVLGDGRLSLERRDDQFGLLTVDAFSSDSVPVHLLTEEAFAVYLGHLSEHGLLAFHISNRYLDLEPVLGAVAEDLGLTAVTIKDRSLSDADADVGKVPSTWVVVARAPEDLAALEGMAGVQPIRTESGVAAWTDDYSNLVSILRW